MTFVSKCPAFAFDLQGILVGGYNTQFVYEGACLHSSLAVVNLLSSSKVQQNVYV